MPRRVREPRLDASLERTIAWAAATFVAVSVVGLRLEPGLSLLWIVGLVFSVSAVGTIVGDRLIRLTTRSKRLRGGSR